MQIEMVLPEQQAARERGRRMSKLVTDKAERREPGFAQIAAEVAEQWLRAMHLAEKTPVSSESINSAVKRAGVVPHDDRAFGSVIRRLQRDGVIVYAGPCRRVRGNDSRGGSLWHLSPTWKGYSK